MNIIHEYQANMEWLHLWEDYNAWYRYIRNNIFQGQEYCAYQDYNEEDCHMLIYVYQSEIDNFFEYLNPWTYSIVNHQVKIDLLNQRLYTIRAERKKKLDK